MVDYRRLWRVLERFASTLVGHQDLDAILAQFGEDVSGVLGVSGAGIMLEDEAGRLRFRSASDTVLKELERLQIELDEGPCLLAYRIGEQVLAADLGRDHRFPEFGPRAIRVGMASVYSFPMRLGDSTVGAINLYNTETVQLDDEQLAVGETLANVATIYLLHAWEVDDLKGVNEQLTHALETRVVVEQAKGFLAAQTDWSPEHAKEIMRVHARSRQLRLHDVARKVLEGELTADDLAP